MEMMMIQSSHHSLSCASLRLTKRSPTSTEERPAIDRTTLMSHGLMLSLSAPPSMASVWLAILSGSEYTVDEASVLCPHRTRRMTKQHRYVQRSKSSLDNFTRVQVGKDSKSKAISSLDDNMTIKEKTFPHLARYVSSRSQNSTDYAPESLFCLVLYRRPQQVLAVNRHARQLLGRFARVSRWTVAEDVDAATSRFR